MSRGALVALCLLSTALLAAPPASAGASVDPFAVGPYTGYVGVPANPAAAGHLVLILKGVNHVASDHIPYLADIADAGAVGVALDYTDFDADFTGAGAVAVTQHFLTAYPSVHTVTMVGISGGMPGGTLALAAGATKPGGGPLFDFLINVEGVTNFAETYYEARAAFLAAPAAGEAIQEIEAECGSPADNACLAARSAVARAPDWKAAGLRGVFTVHAVNDGLVPYNQAVEIQAALAAAGIPASFTTVTRGDYEDDRDTAATEYATGPLGLPDVDVAGHATETHRDHPVVAAALAVLFDLLANGTDPSTHGFRVVDRAVTATLP